MQRLNLLILVLLLTPATQALGDASKAIDVYLIGGQSNATGQGYLANLPKNIVPDTRVLLFHSGKPHLDSGSKPDAWIPLRQASESPDRFGPELGFGNRLQELLPDRKIAIIKHAHSGTNLYSDWNPGKDTSDQEHFGRQFKVFVETVQAGLAGLRGMGYEPRLVGMIWQQGESDTKSEAAAAAYGRNLAHFIARVRQQFRAPNLLFVYGYVLPPPNAGQPRDLVREGEKEVDQDSHSALAVKGAFVVPTDDLSQRATDPHSPYPNDHVHFGTAGTYELGRRMADKIAAELRARDQ